MARLINKISEKVYTCVSKNMLAVYVFGGLGILAAIIGHYGQMGFNWKWFLFFELPLFAFLVWAIVSVFGNAKRWRDKDLGLDNDKNKDCC